MKISSFFCFFVLFFVVVVVADCDTSASHRPARQAKRNSQKGRGQQNEDSRCSLNNSGTCKDGLLYNSFSTDGRLNTAGTTDTEEEKKETLAHDACFLLDDWDNGVAGDCKLHSSATADVGEVSKETPDKDVCIILDDVEVDVATDDELHTATTADIEKEKKETLTNKACVQMEDWDVDDNDADLPPLALPSLAQRLKPSSSTTVSVCAAISQNRYRSPSP